MEDTTLKGDELIHFSGEMNQAKVSDFESDNCLIIIHGFTASSNYLRYLAKTLGDNGLNVFLFNYNSYRGIEKAAKSLFNILELFDELGGGSIRSSKLTFVCHSMGGLVARAFIQVFDGGLYTKGVATLGTPHNGTLYDSELLETILKWGEFVSGFMPYATPDCASAAELIGKDQNQLINRLNNDTSKLKHFDFLTVSGGKPYLYFGIKGWNFLVNRSIQKSLKDKKNDGLVTEISSNLSLHFEKAEHFNDYADYDDINHSYLIENQYIALKVAAWAKKLTR